MEEHPFNHAGFEAWIQQRRLMAARCVDCGRLYLPPRPLCPTCFSSRMEWVECSGEGKLAGFTTIYVGMPAMVARGFDRSHPYSVGIVQLAEGPIINAQLIPGGETIPGDETILGDEALPGSGSARAEAQVGTPVRLAFIEHEKEGQVSISLAFSLPPDTA